MFSSARLAPAVHHLASKCSRGLAVLGLGAVLGGAWVAPSVRAQEAGVKLVPDTGQGQPAAGGAWHTSRENPVLLFKPLSAGSLTAAAGAPVYLGVTYQDRGYARLAVTYKTADGSWVKPDKITSAVLLDSGKTITSYARCPGLSADQPEVKIGSEDADAGTLAITGVTLQATPFNDKHFQYILDEAWRRPYDGPTTPSIDNRTLRGKVMVGYQGWFRTPNDPYNAGWEHWGDLAKHDFAVDMWPDVSAYPPEALEKAADVKTLSGKTAYLFSSAWPEAVRVQFAWMRKYDIAGAFVQRYLGNVEAKISLGGTGGDWVLGNVREAANREGRIWAVTYDISSVSDDKLLDHIQKDWKWLVDSFGVLQDPSYAHERGKPVVFVWGMPLPSRHISVATANAVMDFLKNDPKYGGNYVIGALEGNWRTYDAGWIDHIRRYDCVQVWHSHDYAGDFQDFQAMNMAYYPMVWPGFSWANLKHQQTVTTDDYKPREGGRFYEDQLSKAVGAHAQRLYVGMFDEYSEGTAIMPMSDDPPPTNKHPGVDAHFFANEKFEGSSPKTKAARVELALDSAADGKNRPATHFSVRYQGTIIAPVGGKYAFAASAAPGDGARLLVGGQRAGGDPLPNAVSSQAAVELTAGQRVPYRLDYRHGAGPGQVRLLWQKPGSVALEPVPDAALVDDWGRFITNDGEPPDHWLALTGKWAQVLSEKVAAPARTR